MKKGEPTSKTKGVAVNTVISTTARIIGLGLALIIIGLLTRYLKKEGYGNYTTVIAYLAVFTAIADLGLYSLFLRDISRKRAHEIEIASNIFSLRFFSLLLITPIAIAVAFFLPYPGQVKIGIAIAGASAVLLSLQQVLMPIFQKYLKMVWVAAGEVAGRLVQLGLVYLLIKMKLSLPYFLGALVVANFTGFSIQFIRARKLVPFRLKINLEAWKNILKKALPIGIGLIFVLIYFKLDTVMLSLMKTPQAVGIYGLAYKVLENLIFFPAMFVGLVTPFLSKYAFENRQAFQKTFQKGLNFIIIILVPLVVGIAFLALPIVTILGGENFATSAQVLRILSLAIGLIFLGSIFGNSVIVLKKQVQSAWVYGAGAVLNLGANLYFIPKYSYIGAAWTTVITEGFVTFFLFYIVYKAYKWRPCFKMVIKAVVAVIPMALFLYYLSCWNVFGRVITAASIYGASLFALGGIKIEEVKELIAMRRKVEN